MKTTILCCALMLGCSAIAEADVWMWVDAQGKTHFVDTNTPIYTWVDSSGDVHYSDTPDHEDAVSVELVWHAKGSVDELSTARDDDNAYPGETPDERHEREQAEAYYCKRATEIYDSYINAPRLYRTDANGEREYLDKDDAAKMIAETRAKKDDLCG